MKFVSMFFAAAIWLILAYMYIASEVIGESIAALPNYLSLFFHGDGNIGALGIVRAMSAPLVPVAVGALITSVVFGLLREDRRLIDALYTFSLSSVFGIMAYNYFFRYVRIYIVELGSIDFGLFGLKFLLFAPLAVLGSFLAAISAANRRSDIAAGIRLGVVGVLYTASMIVVNSVYIIQDFSGALIARVVGAILAVAVITFINGIFAIISLMPGVAILYLTRIIFPIKFVLTDA
ncbi:MAG: hypothetical protein FWE20_11270 [Defluviitaleaceae bacterium]|nr:hypothetical protein [Defluviitaleaceae bacterium]